MGTIDNTTWQALGLTLTVLGLVVSFVLWRRRGAASGLRAAAWSLLPLAAGLTGTLRLCWEILDSVVTWATRLVFSPVVWTGVALAGVSAALFVVSALLRRHAPTRRTTGRGDRPAVTASPSTGRRPAAGTDDDMADIEAIWKKHGIS